MKPRIGLLLLGHPDYQNDIALHFASQGAELLRQAGLEVVFDPAAHVRPLEAAASARQLLKQDIEGMIILPGTWLEGDVATAAVREIEHLPFALWGLPMFDWEEKRESTGSFVAVCSLKGPLTRMGYAFKSIIGLPDDSETKNSLIGWAYAAHAAERLKRLRAGLIGYSAMHIYAGMFDHVLLRRHIGPEIVHLDTYTLIREAEHVSPEAVGALAARVKGLASVEASDERLRKACGLGVALQTLVKKHHLDALTVKCQYELSQEYGMTPCLPMALLADEGVVASCEGDVMVLVTQALLGLLTGQVAPYGDILDLQGDTMLLSSCGFAPFSLANQSDTCRVCEFGHPGFDGLICSFTLKRAPVTIARLSEGLGNYKLLYATGTGIETDLRQGRFPALQIKLDGDPQALLENLASQHFALCYGDQTERLEDWCRIAGVQAVRV
ncbi:MAG: hypothetical protein ACYC63_20240 [Armatimonadota bacterium]